MENVFPPQPKRIRVTLESDNHTNLAADLWKKRPEFTDVVFLVGGREFPAHKMVLASKSDYFKRMLYGRMKEASQKKIKLFPDGSVAPATFQKVLQYAYIESLKLDEPLDDILAITYAADCMSFTELKSKLGEHLKNSINVGTVIKLYVFSKGNELLTAHHIDKKCLDFIENPSNTSAILKSEEFLELPKDYLKEVISRDTFVAPENDILQAVLKWKAHNEEEDIAGIVEQIRLSRFTAMEIFTIVEPTGLFTETDILDGIRVVNTADLSRTRPRGRYYYEGEQTNFLAREAKDITFDSRYKGEISISLPRSYLLNFLCFEVHPDLPASDKSKGYTYEVRVQLDGQTMLTLFDYSNGDYFNCRGQQVLFFPTLTLRYNI
ncbi:BTB/POZ domain-containing protein 9 [Geodia barretti]|uniref:BTB/POZ domain-containing protein 9 n=1 Tax=Geodia barretti TaxID=519541 RepID=A0AA35WCI6_GEOBA|nr:BTB/POZ domain-containing protein 9 [Geodia barretti]